jgi:hypothetical protein
MDFNEDSLMNIISLFDLWHRLGVFVFFPVACVCHFEKIKGLDRALGGRFP